MIRTRILVGLFSLTVALCSPPAQSKTIADPFKRADVSFSRFAMNVPTKAHVIGRLTNGEECDGDMILCTWEDPSGVEHVLVDNKIAIKTISVKRAGTTSLPALNIGMARSRDKVLARVRAFLPEIKIDCLEPGEAGEGEGIASCGGAFNNGGWFKLLFDANNQLLDARIDAYQIN
jgi:hypothetical protein